MTTTAQRPENHLFIPAGNDGWTLPGYFAPLKNVHDEIRFQWRPYTPEERAHVLQGLAQAPTNREMTRLTTLALASRLREWNLTYQDAQGHYVAAPLTVEFVGQLIFPVWDRLVGVVLYQNQFSDTDPEWAREDKTLFDEASFRALVERQGTQSGNVLETLQKN